MAMSLNVFMFALLATQSSSQSVVMDSANTVEASKPGALSNALRGSGIVVTDDVEKDFLEEVEDALGTHLVDRSRERMAEIMKGLRPMFESLEKNPFGKLEAPAVRYALHRLFQARHGWLMKGLDPAGQRFNTSSPVEALEGKAPVHVQEIFEKRLSAEGFGLQELAVFASVLETLVSMEAAGRLKDIYAKLGMDLATELDINQVDDMMDFYMTIYIVGKEAEAVSGKKLKTLKSVMTKVYGHWPETQQYVRKVRSEAMPEKEQVTFADLQAVLVKIGEGFGQMQNGECQGMKQRLLALEGDESGCVPLSSFYAGHFKSDGEDWQFSESIDYLRENGILDNSDPSNMKVMVANYMYAPGNCIGQSQYYSICCIDECQSLFGQIERQVRGTTASPEDLAYIVASLSSDTVPANRTLAPAQFRQLLKIAEYHSGKVPIHGRLFMQWMHMVYPRECAFPQLAGTTKPMAPEEWSKTKGGSIKSAVVTKEEMSSFINAPVANKTGADQGQCGRWIDEEELFTGGQTSRRLSIHELESDFNTWLATSCVFLLCLAAVATIATKHLFGARKHSMSCQSSLMLV